MILSQRFNFGHYQHGDSVYSWDWMTASKRLQGSTMKSPKSCLLESRGTARGIVGIEEANQEKVQVQVKERLPVGVAADCGTTWGFENWSVILATISGGQEWPEQEQFQWGSGERSWLDRLTASEVTGIRTVNMEEWHSAWREMGCEGGDTESALRNLSSYLTQPWHSSVNVILVIKFYCIF